MSCLNIYFIIKGEAEMKMMEAGTTFEWINDDEILKTTTAILPAIRMDSGSKRKNEKTFFNSVIAAYTGWNDSRNVGEKAVILGDEIGTPLDSDDVNTVLNIMNDICVAIPWQEGDMIIVDNRACMHSRRPYRGDRRILASLARDPSR
jgi:hypothetical protein